MICLKDQAIQALDKREALLLVPFLLTDTETINIFTRIRIEDIMLELLKTQRYTDKIISQVFKIMVLMHISSNILNVNNTVGDLFVEKGGLTELVKYLEERLVEDKINWKIISRIIQVLFVFCFKVKNVKTLKSDNVLKKLIDTLIKAFEVRQFDTVIEVIKILTFFTDDEVTWSQIICRDVIKGCMMCLSTRDPIEKKFVLAVLNDISTSPVTMKIIKESPWSEGIGKLINLAFVDEPQAVSFIIGNLNRDVVVRNQLITMMPREYITDILVSSYQNKKLFRWPKRI